MNDHDWRLEAQRLASGHDPAPDPAPAALLRALCELVGGQRAAARHLRLLTPDRPHGDRTIRRWCAGDQPAPHAAVELLRLIAGGRAP